MGEFYSKQFDEEPFRIALKDVRETEEYCRKVFGEPLTPLELRIRAQERVEVLLEHPTRFEEEQLTPMEAAMKRFEEEPFRSVK